MLALVLLVISRTDRASMQYDPQCRSAGDGQPPDEVGRVRCKEEPPDEEEMDVLFHICCSDNWNVAPAPDQQKVKDEQEEDLTEGEVYPLQLFEPKEEKSRTRATTKE